MQRRRACIHDQALHLISKQKPRHPISRPLISVILFIHLLPTSLTKGKQECLSTGKIRAEAWLSMSVIMFGSELDRPGVCWGGAFWWPQDQGSVCRQLFCRLHKDTIFKCLYCGLWASVMRLRWKSAPTDQRPGFSARKGWRDHSRSGITSLLQSRSSSMRGLVHMSGKCGAGYWGLVRLFQLF